MTKEDYLDYQFLNISYLSELFFLAEWHNQKSN